MKNRYTNTPNFRTLFSLLTLVLSLFALDAKAQNAVCQNTTITLGSGGTATLSAAAIDGGSSGYSTRYISRTGHGYTDNAKIGSQAFGFDGAGDQVNLGSAFSFHYYTAFTVEAWVKTTDDEGAIISRYLPYSPYSGWGLQVVGGQVKFGMTSDHNRGYRANITSTQTINDGQWHHIAATHSYSYGTTSGLKLYIDGVQASVTTDGSGQNQTCQYSNSHPAYIGRNNQGTSYLEGLIDDLRVWSTVRSASEIANNKNAAIATPYPTSLMAYYTMDNTSVPFLDDDKGSANGYISGIYSASIGLNNDDVESPISNAYAAFDGTNDYAKLSSASQYNFQPSDDFSLEMWVKTTDDDGFLARNGDINNGAGWFFFLENDKLNFAFFQNYWSGNRLLVKMNQAMNDGQWHHVAVTYNGNGNASGIAMYLDGEAQATSTTSNALSTGTMTYNNVPYLGAPYNLGNANYHYSGAMEDVRIWNEARSAAEISAEMETPLLQGAALVGAFPWTAGSGTIELNHGSGSGAATFYNGTAWETKGSSAVGMTLTAVSGSNASQCHTLVTVNPYGGARVATTTEAPLATRTEAAVFPNPTRGEVTIKGEGELNVTVYDLQGRQVAQATGYQQATLNLGHENTGMYVAVVQDAQGQVTRHRIIKQ